MTATLTDADTLAQTISGLESLSAEERAQKFLNEHIVIRKADLPPVIPVTGADHVLTCGELDANLRKDSPEKILSYALAALSLHTAAIIASRVGEVEKVRKLAALLYTVSEGISRDEAEELAQDLMNEGVTYGN